MSVGVYVSAEELKVQLVSEERYLEDRISHVERNFAALATDMGGMVRRTARLRDKGDKIVKTFQDFASNESGGMKKSLEGLAECCSALEDCSQFKIDTMETKVVKPLLEYDGLCRKAREELRETHNVGEREVNKQRNLDRARIRDPANRKRLSQLEMDLQKVKVERLRSSKAVGDYMETFERKRTQDLKEVLKEYIHAQMSFHAKALEIYTAAFQHVQNMNEDEVVDLFQKGLHPRKQQTQQQQYSRSASPGVASANTDTPSHRPVSSVTLTPQHHSN